MSAKKNLTAKKRNELLKVLETRFSKHVQRHEGMAWEKVKVRLDEGKLWSLNAMEESGGEPDVIGHDKKSGEYVFADCSPETPKGRTSVCYDRKGLESRKAHKPGNNAMDMAAEMGIGLLAEEDYAALQELGDFDTKTSSWIWTPDWIRKQGGALYAEWRYGRIFIGHNGAQSYYGVRGFRGSLRV